MVLLDHQDHVTDGAHGGRSAAIGSARVGDGQRGDVGYGYVQGGQDHRRREVAAPVERGRSAGYLRRSIAAGNSQRPCEGSRKNPREDPWGRPCLAGSCDSHVRVECDTVPGGRGTVRDVARWWCVASVVVLGCSSGGDGSTASPGDGGRANDACVTGATSPTDLPDPANLDTNCDGIDGDIRYAVFVAADGDDGDDGTMNAPVRSLHAALAVARRTGRTQVLVASGAYTEPTTLELVDSVGIYGGYDRAAHWQRGHTAMAVLTGSSLAMEARGLSRPTVVARLEVHAADGSSAGQGSVVLRAVESPSLSVTDGAVLVAGAGGAGAGGNVGVMGDDGVPGGAGADGSPDDRNSAGAGGAGGDNPRCHGAHGGDGGSGGRQYSEYTGDPGRVSAGGAMGGIGASMSSGCSGRDGADGVTETSPGATGSNGAGGTGEGTLDPETFDYRPSMGATGNTGSPGVGGGGGGGSSGQTVPSAYPARGTAAEGAVPVDAAVRAARGARAVARPSRCWPSGRRSPWTRCGL